MIANLEDGVRAFDNGDFETATKLLATWYRWGNPEALYRMGSIWLRDC